MHPDTSSDHDQLRRILIPALILLLAFALRVHRLAYDSIWWDEGYSVWMSRFSLTDMFFQTANDAHPPLSYMLLRGWVMLVGGEEFPLRVQSVMFGVLTVAIAYRIGRLAGGQRAGWAAMLLTAAMRLTVWWSQEIRMYALAALFAALAMWAALRLFQSSGKRLRWAILLALSTAAGLLTLYLYAGAVLALNIAFVYAFIVTRDRWRMAAAWIGSQVAALLMVIPWIVYALRYLPSWETPQQAVDFAHVAKLYLSTIFLGIATDIDRYLILLIIALVVLVATAVVTLIVAPRRLNTLWVTLIVGVLLPPILVYVLSLPRGAFNYPTPSPRYFLLLSTPVYVLLGWGAVMLNRRVRHTGTLIVVALLAAQAWSLNSYYGGLHLADDYQSLAATLEALRGPDDAVVLNNDRDWPIFAYHYDEPFDRRITHTQRVWDDAYARGLMNRYRNRNAGLWLVQTRYAEVTDPQNLIGRFLDERSWNQQRFVFPEGELWFYAFNEDRGNPNTMSDAARWPDAFTTINPAPIADGVTLVGTTLPIPVVRAGDRMVVGLGWHLAEGAQGDFPVAVRLVGAGGETLAETALTLSGVGEADRYVPVGLFIPPDAPSGRAQVVFIAGETWQPLGSLRVDARAVTTNRADAIPATATPIGARFGDGIILAAAELPASATVVPGDSLPLVLYWQAESTIPDRYKVFIHLRGDAYDPSDDSNIWGQQDQEPRNAAYPTTSWLPGDVIADDYLVPIQPDALPGIYELQVGFYLPVSGQRLPVTGPTGDALGDVFTLLEIEIR